jgi:hypothetical protein
MVAHERSFPMRLPAPVYDARSATARLDTIHMPWVQFSAIRPTIVTVG